MKYFSFASLKHQTNIFLLFTSFFILAACQPHSVTHSNITALSNDSGFGGTGHSSSGFGGTGIIGTITEFGSIWVNGIEVGYGDLTTITSDLTTNHQLKLGQQVILETLPRDDKTLTQSIHIYYPIAGQITQYNKEQLVIDGHYKIHLTEDTLFDKNLVLKKGGYVSINGYQSNKNQWVATRINQNTSQQRFYHALPSKSFSNNVHQVIIETSFEQLNEWKSALKIDLTENLSPSKSRLILQGEWHKGELLPKEMMDYSEVIKHQNNHQPSMMLHQSRELMQLQKDQQHMVQERIEQMHQLKDLKGQMELHHNIN